eukprot:COSAG04_NODE_22105_length_361_cov_0.687023_1_plen_22_part_10
MVAVYPAAVACSSTVRPRVATI